MALDIPEVWGIFHHSGKIHGCRCGFKIMAPANQVHPHIVKGRAWTTYNFSKSKVSHNLINFACHLNWASLWQSRPLIPFGMHLQSLHHSFGQVVAGSGPSIFVGMPSQQQTTFGQLTFLGVQGLELFHFQGHHAGNHILTSQVVCQQKSKHGISSCHFFSWVPTPWSC